MTYRCFLAALFSGALLLSLSACDDSSTVGLGIGPDSLEGGQPVTVTASPDTFDTFTEVDVTSHVASSTDSIPANGHRILVGTVDDPLVGTVATRGHIDFRQPDGVGNFESIDGVNLILQTEYRYGDTSGVQTIDVREADTEIQSDWTADESGITFGDVITSFDVAASDTTVTVSLPSSWVAANGPTLFSTSTGSDSYDALFEGLVLTTQSGNRVTGFDRESSFLQVAFQPAANVQDTLEYDGAKSFTHIERTTAAAPPNGTELLLDGLGTNLVTNFDFTDPPFDELGLVPVNRAELVLPIDSTALEQSTPANFVRPSLEGIFLRARAVDSLRAETSTGELSLCRSLGLQTTVESSCLIDLSLTGTGLGAPNSAMRRIVERTLLEEAPLFDQYVLELNAGEPTITPLLLSTPDATNENNRPRLQVTVVPQN